MAFRGRQARISGVSGSHSETLNFTILYYCIYYTILNYTILYYTILYYAILYYIEIKTFEHTILKLRELAIQRHFTSLMSPNIEPNQNEQAYDRQTKQHKIASSTTCSSYPSLRRSICPGCQLGRSNRPTRWKKPQGAQIFFAADRDAANSERLAPTELP